MKLIEWILISITVLGIFTIGVILMGVILEGPNQATLTILEHLLFRENNRLAKKANKDKIVNGTKWTLFLEKYIEKIQSKNRN